MIERIFMFIHFFSSEFGFRVSNGSLTVFKPSKSLFFMFDNIKFGKHFLIEIEFDYNNNKTNGKLIYKVKE